MPDLTTETSVSIIPVSGGRWILIETMQGACVDAACSISWFGKANADATTIFWDELDACIFKHMSYAVNSAASQLVTSLQTANCLG
ncbi:hypothetical protein ASD02_35850 [Ensifer sp. Root1252]|nr:hypothetical protein ASD00_02905 [Ensifer sp. Root31]KQW42140.1 hypothetical protein ASD02_35850 [Ensifer sp. Root1252]KQY65120.1 hypothetical protein ASD52_35540 [Ensifer sp. Root142]KRC62262.1 hypothetical protein ASE32_35940 [Ensifer sp. Root231]KRC93566.1 hypothetical protein ASE47_35910 [Ensifer sp. Root258]